MIPSIMCYVLPSVDLLGPTILPSFQTRIFASAQHGILSQMNPFLKREWRSFAPQPRDLSWSWWNPCPWVLHMELSAAVYGFLLTGIEELGWRHLQVTKSQTCCVFLLRMKREMWPSTLSLSDMQRHFREEGTTAMQTNARIEKEGETRTRTRTQKLKIRLKY